MATHITHIVLTDKIYEEQFWNCDRKNIILWTLLPDIRYLDNSIPKESTHSYNISLEAIQSLTTCFEKGMLFHSLLDRVRDEFYISRWIYTFWWDEDFIMALKLLEDEYLYNKIKNRDMYLEYFDNIPYQNTPNIKKDTLDTWYAMIKECVAHQPNNITRENFQWKLWVPIEYTNKINNLINKLQKDKKILQLIDELYESFWSLIKQQF